LVRLRECGGPYNLDGDHEVEEHVAEEVNVVEDEGYHGGPIDRFLLVRFEDYIARQL